VQKIFNITLQILIVFAIFGFAGHVLAQTPTPGTEYEKQKLTQIQELQGKVDELQKQGKTLSNQIDIMNKQIQITELRIGDTNEKIDELGEDIDYTSLKVATLEKEILISTKRLLERMNAVQKVGKMEAWQIFLTSTNAEQFITRLKYLKIVQLNDHKMLYSAEQARVTYEQEKAILEEKQQEQEELSNELENYTNKLEQDKKSKDQLLQVTKNSEKEYQKRLSDALRELRQIQAAAKVLISEEPKDVKKGDAIGLMGSTGYSFGAHLHFGVYGISSLDQYNYYSGHVNPSDVLENRSVNWSTDCSSDPSGNSNTGNGSYSWPMSTSGLYITQGYGHTCYSDVYYKGQPHPAYDMYNSSNIVVTAAQDGKAYFCRNCTGDGANGVFIFHSDGKMTLYWHLQ